MAHRGVAQSGRVLALGARCRRFEPFRPDQSLKKCHRNGGIFFQIMFGTANSNGKSICRCSNLSLGTWCLRGIRDDFGAPGASEIYSLSPRSTFARMPPKWWHFFQIMFGAADSNSKSICRCSNLSLGTWCLRGIRDDFGALGASEIYSLSPRSTFARMPPKWWHFFQIMFGAANSNGKSICRCSNLCC